MTKKIEITSRMTASILADLMSNFTNNNSNSVSGSCQMHLMSGEIPIDDNGFYPKNFNVGLLPNANMQWPPGDGSSYYIIGFTPGTYTATVTAFGQTITASVDATENEVSNFQILSRSGHSTFFTGNGNIFFPFQIPALANIYSNNGSPGNINIDLYAWFRLDEIDLYSTGPMTSLVNWTNNRIKYSGGVNDEHPESGVALSTYAAAARTSGIATWFYANNYNSGAYILGTVGLTGSGADLELDDVNIVQGKTYGISNLRIQMPMSFTY